MARREAPAGSPTKRENIAILGCVDISGTK